jgi:hypothetical protein
VKPPALHALRLVCASGVVKPPRPPLGLAGWSADAADLCVLLDASDVDLTAAPAIAAQLPEATSLGPRTYVFVLGAAMRTRRGLGRWLGPAAVPVGRAARCAALLARGYTNIGATAEGTADGDLVFGLSESARPSEARVRTET